MKRGHACISGVAVLAMLLSACGDGESTETGSGATSAGGTGGTGGASTGTSTAGGGTDSGTGGTLPPLTCDEVKPAIDAYKQAHPGNGGKDWDVVAKSPAEIAADPYAAQLLALCATDQRPIIPLLAWEYGGGDHPWINPEASALFYCVYIPVDPNTEHWEYDAVMDHVSADVTIGCPDLNPCKDASGPDLVMGCLGAASNIEIIVDTASLHDGTDVGLNLSEASTDLYLIEPNGNKVHLYTGL